MDDDRLEQPRPLSDYRSPEVLAPTAFALAVAALLGGFGLLSGSIVLALTDASQPSQAANVLAALLGAALAAIPLLMGLEAVRNLLEDDPLWVSALARASVLLGGIVVLLRLAHTLVYLLGDGPAYPV